eukprot:gene33180-40941_t
MGKKSIDEKSLYKWIDAAQRFEFLDWNGDNDLSKQNCKSKLILEKIEAGLKANNSEAAKWNQFVKSSPSSCYQYGVVAKQDIALGTTLGYFRGNLVMDTDEDSECGVHSLLHKSFGLADPNNEQDGPSDRRYIDGSAFDSCFGRYYVTSPIVEAQNVAVERFTDWTDHNRAIVFIANADIKEGEELLIPPDQDYARHRSKKAKVDRQV